MKPQLPLPAKCQPKTQTPKQLSTIAVGAYSRDGKQRNKFKTSSPRQTLVGTRKTKLKEKEHELKNDLRGAENGVELT